MAQEKLHPVLSGGIDFTSTATASGVLEGETDKYRLATNADCWLYMDDGGRDVLGGDDFFLAAGQETYLATTANRSVLGVQGWTTSGILSWTRLGV